MPKEHTLEISEHQNINQAAASQASCSMTSNHLSPDNDIQPDNNIAAPIEAKSHANHFWTECGSRPSTMTGHQASNEPNIPTAADINAQNEEAQQAALFWLGSPSSKDGVVTSKSTLRHRALQGHTLLTERPCSIDIHPRESDAQKKQSQEQSTTNLSQSLPAGSIYYDNAQHASRQSMPLSPALYTNTEIEQLIYEAQQNMAALRTTHKQTAEQHQESQSMLEQYQRVLDSGTNELYLRKLHARAQLVHAKRIEHANVKKDAAALNQQLLKTQQERDALRLQEVSLADDITQLDQRATQLAQQIMVDKAKQKNTHDKFLNTLLQKTCIDARIKQLQQELAQSMQALSVANQKELDQQQMEIPSLQKELPNESGLQKK